MFDIQPAFNCQPYYFRWSESLVISRKLDIMSYQWKSYSDSEHKKSIPVGRVGGGGGGGRSQSGGRDFFYFFEFHVL